MLENLPITDLKMYFIVFVTLLSIVLVWYYWRIYIPYSKFKSCRMELLPLNWMFKRVELNCVGFRMVIEVAKKYEAEGMFVAWFGFPILFVYGEEVVKLIVNEHTAVNKPMFYKLFEFALGKGIITSDGDTWRKQRKQVAPAFHPNMIKSYTPVIIRNAEALVKELSELPNHQTDDIVRILSKCSLNTIYESSVKTEESMSAEESAFMIKALRIVMDFFVYRIFSPWIHWDFSLFFSSYARKALKMEKTFKGKLRPRLERMKENMIALQNVPDVAKTDLDDYKRKQKTFSEILVQQHLQDPSFTMDQLTTEIGFLISAGFDTIAHSLKFCLLLLGLHQDVQDKVYEEIMSVNQGNVQYEDLHDLTYLECVIKETLRLYSPPMFGRCPEKNLQCGKHLIPKGTIVIVLSYMLHRNPEIYPNPEKFNPERFMEENTKIKPWNYIPFAEGIRNCLGKNFAMVEMKIILVHLLRHFRIISLTRIEELELKWSIVLDCLQNLRMQFIPRQQVSHNKVPEGKL